MGLQRLCAYDPYERDCLLPMHRYGLTSHLSWSTTLQLQGGAQLDAAQRKKLHAQCSKCCWLYEAGPRHLGPRVARSRISLMPCKVAKKFQDQPVPYLIHSTCFQTSSRSNALQAVKFPELYALSAIAVARKLNEYLSKSHNKKMLNCRNAICRRKMLNLMHLPGLARHGIARGQLTGLPVTRTPVRKQRGPDLPSRSK